MNIVLMEPLGIDEEKLSELSAPLKAQGHSFAAYKQFTAETAEMIRRAEDADILMIANHALPAEVIEASKSLSFISVAFVGIDHVAVDSCRARGIRISNTGGYCTDAVAELAVGLTLDCLRQISRGNQAVQAGAGKAGLQGHELAGKTVGIIGTGAIGLRTAQIFSAFGCRLIGYSRTRKEEAQRLGLAYMPLDEVMKTADIVSVHTPLTPDTRGLIGPRQIREMKQGAVLINTARGPVVDTDALAEALYAGHIAAGTDVYEADPPLPGNHPLLKAPNLVCTPHVGFDTKESIERRAGMAFENVQSYLDGKPVRCII